MRCSHCHKKLTAISTKIVGCCGSRISAVVGNEPGPLRPIDWLRAAGRSDKLILSELLIGTIRREKRRFAAESGQKFFFPIKSHSFRNELFGMQIEYSW